MALFVRAHLAALLVAAVAGSLGAQQAPSTCAAPEHRQFDFWIGMWDVFNPEGRQVGVNTISLELNGCALHEAWQSVRGPHRGNSYNIYDRASGGWHQTWVDNSGLLLRLDGGLVGESMVLEGRSQESGGTDRRDRITWTPREDGSVRQVWEQSTDGGQTWTVAFDGRYVKR